MLPSRQLKPGLQQKNSCLAGLKEKASALSDASSTASVGNSILADFILLAQVLHKLLSENEARLIYANIDKIHYRVP
jgi:hypothetical protein